MNKALLIVALFAIATITNAASVGKAQVLAQLWSTWKHKHGKTYSATEEKSRFKIFTENLATIAKLNKEHKTAKFGVNHFADLTDEEFKKMYTGALPSHPIEATYTPQAITLPESVDWRTKGAVTKVKDQGSCGSCWTFSATGAIEGSYFIHHGKLVSFSEQQIVDCAKNAGHGCNGGWPYLAIQYVATNGIETEADYPYTARDGTCRYNAAKAVKATTGYKAVTSKSSDLLKTALVSQPVSVCVQADQSAFRYYKSGVVTTGCGASINHAVLAVGYTKVGALEAFIVKNSWGTGWGNQGYIYLSTVQQINNGQGVCGILYQPIIAA